MRFQSITVKLLMLVIGAFLITIVSVLLVADRQLTRIVDRSQSAIYAEKVDVIWNTLRRADERLQKTGLIEAYQADFQQSVLGELRTSYFYSPESSATYPAVLAVDGQVVLHPRLAAGNTSLRDHQAVKEFQRSERGEFTTVHKGEKKWYVYRHFRPWNWVIVYGIPLDLKYGDARALRDMLALVMVAITLIVVIALSVILARMTKPIVRLTEDSLEIAEGDLDREISLQGWAEIGELARSVNTMRNAIRYQLNELRSMSLLFESAATPIAMSDMEQRITYVNPAFLQTWRYHKKDQVIGKNLLDFLMISDHINETLQTVHEKGSITEESMAIRKDGKLFPVETTAAIVFDENKTPIGMTVSSLDITTRKKAEEELRRFQNYLANIIDSMPSILMGVDSEEKITLWNAAAQRTTGLTPDQAIGTPLIQALPHLADKIGVIHEAIRTGKEQTDLGTARIEDGVQHFENTTIYPLISNDEQGAVIRIDDVTNEREMVEQLNQARKMDAVGQLAGGIAHDFNNMLGGIMGAAQLLQLPKSELNKECQTYVDMILRAAEQAADLTKKLLVFSRKKQIEAAAVDAHQVIDDTIAIFDRTIDKKIRIQVEKNAEDYTVMGDYPGLQNVLLNLGINASHAMPDGGDLLISTHNTELDAAYCSYSPFDLSSGNHLEIQVRDTGCGIEPEDLNKIFEPFFTTKKQGEGTGLGLAAVYGTIREHHGAITVHSEVGTGTVFHIYLPLAQGAAETKDMEADVIRGSGTILLVDDEDVIRFTGRKTLESLGYQVMTAVNGEEALQIYKERNKAIDIVLMDMIMPIMNGTEAFYKMKRINEDCKVIIASGFTRDESLAELRGAGLCGFIQKPYRASELSRLLATLIPR